MAHIGKILVSASAQKNIITLLSGYYKKKLLKKNISENMCEIKKKSVKGKKETEINSIKFKFN